MIKNHIIDTSFFTSPQYCGVNILLNAVEAVLATLEVILGTQ
jgi:hypothetical protein